MIYIDLDDVIAHTWKLVLELAKNIFEKDLKKEDLISFNLAESLNLTKDQYDAFMQIFHLDENILSIPLNEDFLSFYQKAIVKGDKMMLVTGRPITTRSSTIKWAKKYSLEFEDILFVDKYNRYPNTNMTTLEELRKIPFEFAIEDSYTTSLLLSKSLNIPFYIYRQPWNKKYEPEIKDDTDISFFDNFNNLNKIIQNGSN